MLSTQECCANSAGINKNTRLKSPFHTRANRRSRGLGKVAARPEPQHVLSFLSSEDRVKSPGALRTQAVETASSSWLQTCSSASPKSHESHLPVQPSTSELSCFNTHLLKFSRMIKVTVIFFSFYGVGRGEKVQCTSLLEITLNFNHSKCVLTVVVKWTLPHIQRTRHQFGIQKYHILKSVHWKNSRLAETPSITERASRNAFKTFRLINSSLISPYEVSIWQHLDKNFYTALQLIYL